MYFYAEPGEKTYFFYPFKTSYPYSFDKTTAPFGQIVLDFMEIEPMEILDLLEKHSPDKRIMPVNQSYFQIRDILINRYGNAVVSLMLETLWNKHPYTSPDNNYYIDLTCAKEKLCNMRLLRCEIAQFCANGCNYNWLEDTFINYLDPAFQDLHIQISYRDGKLHQLYESYDIASVLSFDLMNIQYYHIQIKQCKNCWKFFIPKNRSDEIYCDRIYKNGKTCKQIGYFEKEKSDPFKKLFTAARKTQYARIGYNKHIENYRDKHYKPWLKAAQEAKEKFEFNNDIDGFRQWIEDNKNAF